MKQAALRVKFFSFLRFLVSLPSADTPGGSAGRMCRHAVFPAKILQNPVEISRIHATVREFRIRCRCTVEHGRRDMKRRKAPI